MTPHDAECKKIVAYYESYKVYLAEAVAKLTQLKRQYSMFRYNPPNGLTVREYHERMSYTMFVQRTVISMYEEFLVRNKIKYHIAYDLLTEGVE